MRLLNARRHIGADGCPRLTVLVDRIPRLGELTWRHVPAPRQLFGDAAVEVYVGTHQDGSVAVLADIGLGRGFYGRRLKLRMDDGSIRTLAGPYPCSVRLLRLLTPSLWVRSDVGLFDDPASFTKNRDGEGALGAGLTPAAAEAALELAVARARGELARPLGRPTELARPSRILTETAWSAAAARAAAASIDRTAAVRDSGGDPVRAADSDGIGR